MIDIKDLREITERNKGKQKEIDDRIAKANEVRFSFDMFAAAEKGKYSLVYRYGVLREEFKRELISQGFWISGGKLNPTIGWSKND